MGPGDDVRAPDATRTMRLMDDGPRGMMGNPYGVMNLLAQQQLATSAFARDVVNLAGDDDDDDDDDRMDDADDDEENGSDDSEYKGNSDDNNTDGSNGGERRRRDRKSSRSNGPREGSGLADMFAPPRHLICKAGGFEGARASAKDSRRWLLVNLQRDNEFSCHALNRDVWRDELVENLIGEGFVFWQEVRANRKPPSARSRAPVLFRCVRTGGKTHLFFVRFRMSRYPSLRNPCGAHPLR